jgi:hypothetical protein
MEPEKMKHILLAVGFVLAVGGCGPDIIEEAHQKNLALIEEEYQRNVKLVTEQNAFNDRALECMLLASELPIGASETDLPCRRNDGLVDYAHINLTTTRAGSISQWVYEGPNGQTAYLYFNELGKLVAKQLY